MNTEELVLRDGKVALKQIGRTNIAVPVEVDGVRYSASIQHNVWLLWVEESIAKNIIESPKNKVKSCNCNDAAWRTLFKYANLTDVSLHETGDRPH